MFMESKRAFQTIKEKEESMTEQSIPPNIYLGHMHLTEIHLNSNQTRRK